MSGIETPFGLAVRAVLLVGAMWLHGVAGASELPAPRAPRIEALPQPAGVRGPIDLEALARGYERAIQSNIPRGAVDRGPSLLIFVSFAMPEATLARLVDQAARSRATLLLRGFVNGSLTETAGRVQRLIGERRVAFQIDPQAFDRFGVSATPTFVLVRGGAQPMACGDNTCFSSDAFVSVAGDVSLDYALEHFRRGAPRFAGDAARFLARLKG